MKVLTSIYSIIPPKKLLCNKFSFLGVTILIIQAAKISNAVLLVLPESVTDNILLASSLLRRLAAALKVILL